MGTALKAPFSCKYSRVVPPNSQFIGSRKKTRELRISQDYFKANKRRIRNLIDEIKEGWSQKVFRELGNSWIRRDDCNSVGSDKVCADIVHLACGGRSRAEGVKKWALNKTFV